MHVRLDIREALISAFKQTLRSINHKQDFKILQSMVMVVGITTETLAE